MEASLADMLIGISTVGVLIGFFLLGALWASKG